MNVADEQNTKIDELVNDFISPINLVGVLQFGHFTLM